uniref:BTB domain-containing protein n=1 Tax=Panagrellus redivivus TaxID=6233 RepID=A0A7E4W4X9_PANRE
MQFVKNVKDATTFTLNEADLMGKKVGEFLKTSKRAVPCSDGLQWWISWYPAGVRETAKGHVSVYLWINKPVTAKYTFAVDSSSISKEFTYEFAKPRISRGYSQYAPHEQLRQLFRNGKLTITCSVEFTYTHVQLMPVSPAVHQLFDHVSPDFDLVVLSNSQAVHKAFLTLISPVFAAMFSHDTREFRSGKDIITDFDFETVKASIDYCYGRNLKDLSIKKVIGMLRFADKYDIRGIITQLKQIPKNCLSVETFSMIVQYAYDCSKDDLLKECFTFFKDYQDEIKTTEEFSKLPPTLIVQILKMAFSLFTDCDVLRHVHKHQISFIVDYLEQPLIESICIFDFCHVVSYAWECSRDELKKACAKFLNENRMTVTMDKTFLDLPSDTVCQVLKLAALNSVMSVKDSATFTFNETDLTEKKFGEVIETPKRAVPCSDGLQWWIWWYPAGDRETAKGHVSVFLRVNKCVTAKCTFAVGSSSISRELTNEFAEPPFGYGYFQYASHEQLRPLFRNGKLTITCSVEFTSSIQSIPVAPAVYETVEYATPDFNLVLGSKRMQVHKNLLSLVSPVYYKMFENGKFRESQTGESVITDFDYDVIKTAIDYYYGRELKLLTAETYVGVLRFADKMEMKKITVRLLIFRFFQHFLYLEGLGKAHTFKSVADDLL